MDGLPHITDITFYRVFTFMSLNKRYNQVAKESKKE